MPERFPLSAQIAVAMLLGLVLGPYLGTDAGPLGEVGKLVINLIKATATPLLFLAIVSAVVKTEVSGKDGARMLGFAAINATIALVIGLLLSNFIQPGKHLALHAASATNDYADKKIDLLKTLSSYVPQNVVQPFVENAVLPIVILALLLGVGLRCVKREGGDIGVVDQAVAALLRVTEIVLGWVIRLIPFAVFAVVTKTVGEHGFAPFKGLGVYVAVGLLGLGLHVGITYQLGSCSCPGCRCASSGGRRASPPSTAWARTPASRLSRSRSRRSTSSACRARRRRSARASGPT